MMVRENCQLMALLLRAFFLICCNLKIFVNKSGSKLKTPLNLLKSMFPDCKSIFRLIFRNHEMEYEFEYLKTVKVS